jgi:hypothetical protein
MRKPLILNGLKGFSILETSLSPALAGVASQQIA